jgi:hypothetical protein
MWKCPNCQEEHEGQFEQCWNCGEKRSDPVDEGVVVPLPLLEDTVTELLRIQKKQNSIIEDMRWKVGCMFWFLILWLTLWFGALILGGMTKRF